MYCVLMILSIKVPKSPVLLVNLQIVLSARRARGFAGLC